MPLDELLAALAEKLQAPALSLNEAGVCRIVIGGKLGISMEKSAYDDAVIIYSLLGNVPAENREAFYARLLSAQLYSREIGEGCSFGLDEETGEIVLCRKLGLAGVDVDAFHAALSEFANWAEYWNERLALPEAELPQEPRGTEFDPSLFIRA